jgi:hypothetical protein
MTGAKEKLQSIIDAGTSNVEDTLMDIEAEFNSRKDIMVKPAMINYDILPRYKEGERQEISGGDLLIKVKDIGDFELTDHSEQQMYDRLAIPRAYGDKLLKLGEFALLENNLDTMTHRMAEDGLLFRTVNKKLKGWLSPSFKRMDASPIFEEFVHGALRMGFVPMVGHNTSYRYQITMLMPELFELVHDEYIVFTLTITTGDYGGVANSMHLGILRVICTNLATGIEMLRKVHLGRRFDMEDKDSMILSQQTHELDTKTVASAIKDMINTTPNYIDAVKKQLPALAGKPISVKEALATLKRRGIGKDIAEQVATLYQVQTAGAQILPQAPGLWRWSNAISAIAQSHKPDIRIDLEREAMNVLGISLN